MGYGSLRSFLCKFCLERYVRTYVRMLKGVVCPAPTNLILYVCSKLCVCVCVFICLFQFVSTYVLSIQVSTDSHEIVAYVCTCSLMQVCLYLCAYTAYVVRLHTYLCMCTNDCFDVSFSFGLFAGENGAKSDSPLLSDHSSMSHDDTGSLEDLSTGSSPDPCSGDSIFLSLSATKNKEPIKRRRHKVIPVYHHYVMSQEVFTVQTPAKQEVIVKDMLSDYEVPVEHVINTSVLAYDPATYWDGQNFEYPPLSSDNTASMCTTSSVSDIGSHCDIAGLMGTTIATSNTSFDYCAPPPPYGVMCPRSEHQMMSAQNTPSCTTSLPCDIGLLTAHTPASNVNGICTTSITSPCVGGDTPSIPITSAYNVGNSFDMPFTSDQYCYNTRPPQNGYHQMPPYSTYAPHSGIGTHL